MTIVSIIAWVVFLCIFGGLVWAWMGFAPWMPTRSHDLKLIGELTDLQTGMTFLEFGCGTAHVSRYIATKFPNAHIVGIEYALPLFVYSRCKQGLFWPKNLSIVYGNGFGYHLAELDVLYAFGLPTTINTKLKKKILTEMQSGSKFLSYVFALEDWEWGVVTSHKSQHNPWSIHIFVKE